MQHLHLFHHEGDMRGGEGRESGHGEVWGNHVAKMVGRGCLERLWMPIHGTDGALSNLVQCVALLPMAGGLELNDISGPFQPKPVYDSMKWPVLCFGAARRGGWQHCQG